MALTIPNSWADNVGLDYDQLNDNFGAIQNWADSLNLTPYSRFQIPIVRRDIPDTGTASTLYDSTAYGSHSFLVESWTAHCRAMTTPGMIVRMDVDGTEITTLTLAVADTMYPAAVSQMIYGGTNRLKIHVDAASPQVTAVDLTVVLYCRYTTATA